MQADQLERLSISEGTYECDSDSEGYIEDSIDDDLFYASGDIPRLQIRWVATCEVSAIFIFFSWVLLL